MIRLSTHPAWLRMFPLTVQDQINTWIETEGEGVSVLEPDETLSRFRLSPRVCLARVQRTMNHLWKALPWPGRVIWTMQNVDNHGLDDFEMEAVFAPWLHIDLLVQVDSGAPLSRLLIAGTLRYEVAGLALSFDDSTIAETERCLNVLDSLIATNIPVSTLFIGAAEAAALQQSRNALLRRAIENFLSVNKAGLGLSVPGRRTEAALADLAGELAPLSELAQRPILHARFESAREMDLPLRFHDALNRERLRCDSSVRQPYFEGAYQPQPFDLRTPAGIWNPSVFVELPSIPWHGMPGSWNRLWDQRFARNLKRLESLLEFSRMEAYFLELAHNVKLHQSYSNYRVYNWQMPEPSTRSTLVDCGSLQRLDVRSLRECIQRSSRTFGFRWHLAGHDEFLNAASSEAETRIPAHAQSVLKDQIEGHAYLSTVAADEPLRADIQDFTHFIPSGLGRTLEIASGRGQLARVLSPRAVHYVCLELLPVRYDSPVGNTCLSVAADVHALPFAAESFDTIVANNILEHLYEPLAALRDLHRTLSAVGKLFALIPLDQLNPQHNIRTHLWKADADSIRAAFAAAGFQLERLETIDLYALGVQGCFPTCNGLVCKVEASKAEWSD